MLPNYILEHVYSFLDFHTMIRLISVPSVYRYLLTLAHFVRTIKFNVQVQVKVQVHTENLGTLETLEPYYHLNRYKGLTIFDILRFINGVRIYGNNISYGLTRELWINNFEWHRVYGPAIIYRSSHNPNHKYKEGWYLNGGKHRDHGRPTIIVYHDKGTVKYEAYTRHDCPYRPNGQATTVEYNESGEIVSELWQNIDGTIKMIKRNV